MVKNSNLTMDRPDCQQLNQVIALKITNKRTSCVSGEHHSTYVIFLTFPPPNVKSNHKKQQINSE